MASFKNRIVVPKNKTAFSAHIDHIKAGSGNQVSHAPCMSHRIIEVLNEYPAACCGWDGQETDLRKGAYSMLDD